MYKYYFKNFRSVGFRKTAVKDVLIIKSLLNISLHIIKFEQSKIIIIPYTENYHADFM